MRNSKSRNLHHKKLLNKLLVIGVCVGCVGYSSNTAAMMETIRDMFCCCSVSRAEDLTSLRLSVGMGEVNASYDAYHKGKKETDPEKAYELFMTAYCGNGRSAFSKKFRVIVENTVKEFCENQNLFIRDFYDMKRNFTEQTLYFSKHNNKPIVVCYRSLSETLSKMAELQQTTGDIDKAIFLQKQAIFWQFLHVKGDSVLDHYLYNSIEKLERIGNTFLPLKNSDTSVARVHRIRDGGW